MGGGGEMGRSVPFTQAAQPHSGEILPQTCHPRFVLPLKRSHERRGGGGNKCAIIQPAWLHSGKEHPFQACHADYVHPFLPHKSPEGAFITWYKHVRHHAISSNGQHACQQASWGMKKIRSTIRETLTTSLGMHAFADNMLQK